jgi:2-polyprenyl-3-methyl-5-hydroxy-6-metoxy-1,4-benzoquinol methylase
MTEIPFKVAAAVLVVAVIACFLFYRSRSTLGDGRLKLFHKLLAAVQPRVRRARIRQMQERLDLKPGLRVLDLGGTTEIWANLEIPLDITIVNLPGTEVDKADIPWHRVTFLEGDATALPHADDSFDIVFSNSVIEHVGDRDRRLKFAGEVRRLAPVYWVQTPSVYFPLEAHTGIPFWWAMPSWLKDRFYRRWARTLPAWNEMIIGTTYVLKSELRRLFPDSTVITERILGVPKSYSAYRLRPPRP